MSSGQMATENSDYSVITTLDGLESGVCYRYRIISNGHPLPEEHDFCTFPRTAGRLVVGLLADLSKRQPYHAPAIGELAAWKPELLIILGDWDHRDPDSAEAIRAMHRENRSDFRRAGEALREHFLGSVPLAYVWDDHDYGSNNSDRFSSMRDAALAAYKDYWPAYELANPDAGIWHKFSYADLAEFFLLDLRSQRDPNTYKDSRFVPDSEPGANREALRLDPDRSMLDGAELPEGMGTGQKTWLKQSLLTSPFPWKVIISTVTWNPTTEKDDAWWDFLAERQEILDFITGHGITGVIFVSADIHTGGGIDDGTHAGLPEMTIPGTNLNETSRGSPTCALHSSEENAWFSTCGSWSEGVFLHGSGYGLLRLERASATLETHNLLGESLTLTLPAGSGP